MEFSVVDSDQAKIVPYPYVYVNADGSARELHPGERRYLETPFSPFDGARPAVKGSYLDVNGWGEFRGFLKRAKLPPGSEVHAAPEEDLSKPLSKEEEIEFLRSKGVEVTQKPDGSLTVKKGVFK
jgi:hypothetical protein